MHYKNFIWILLLPTFWSLGCTDDGPEPYLRQLHSRDADERLAAAYALLRFAPEVVPRLIEEAGSEHARVRYAVVQLLGKIKDQRAVPVLIASLGDHSANIAQKAAWSLGELRDPTALDSLLAYSNDASVGVRREVIRALGTCHSFTQEPVLSETAYVKVIGALNDPRKEVRIAALQGLREFGYRNAAESVLALYHDPEPEVRHVVVQSLGQIAAGSAPEAPAVIEPELREAIIDTLIVALDEKEYQSIRTKAAMALAECNVTRAVPRLEQFLIDGTEEDGRQASSALDKIQGSPSIRP